MYIKFVYKNDLHEIVDRGTLKMYANNTKQSHIN